MSDLHAKNWVFLQVSGFFWTVLIIATKYSSWLKYYTVELLKSSKLWNKVSYPSFYVFRYLGHCRMQNGSGVSHNPCLYCWCKKFPSTGPLFWVAENTETICAIWKGVLAKISRIIWGTPLVPRIVLAEPKTRFYNSAVDTSVFLPWGPSNFI